MSATTYELAIDISNYTQPLTLPQLVFIRDNVHTVIIGLQSAVQARAFKLQIKVGCPGVHLEYYLDRLGRDLSIPDPGSRVWIDIEIGCFIRRVDVLAAIPTIRQVQCVPGIYGNAVSIQPVMGLSTELADMGLELWYANYGAPPLNFNAFQPFNGWTRPLNPVMWQYSSGGIAGINCDLNMIEIKAIIKELYYVPNPVWVTEKNPPPTRPFRTFMAFETPTGMFLDYIESKDQEDALRAVGIISATAKPKPVDLKWLNQFAGTPRPDDP